MLRIITIKFPYKGLAGVSQRPSRLCCATRYYLTRNFASDSRPPRRRFGRGVFYTLGTLTLVAGGTVAYAKYDPEFRNWLKENVPYSDDFIRVVLQEEHSFQEQIEIKYKAVGNKFYSIIYGDKSEAKQESSFSLSNIQNLIFGNKEEEKKVPQPLSKSEQEEKKAPKSLPVPVTQKKSKQPEDDLKEVKLTKPPEPEKPEKVKSEKPVESKVKKLPEEQVKSLAQLEEKIAVAAARAVEAYEQAASYLQDYNSEVFKIIETSVDELQDSKLWTSLKIKMEVKDRALREAEEKAESALAQFQQMKTLLNGFDKDADQSVLAAVRQNVENVMGNVAIAVGKLHSEKKRSNLTEKYFRQVEESRRHFTDELEILFPSVRIAEKKLKISEDQLDLFVHHAYRQVLYYQKELHKLETLGQEQLRNAVESLGKGPGEGVTKAQLELELAKQRRILINNFEKEILKLRAESEKELKKQLKLQTEIHADHLADLVKLKEQQKDRENLRLLDEKLTAEQVKYQKQLAAMIGRLKGLEVALKERAVNEKGARDCQMLWGACQSLLSALRTVKPNIPWQEQLKPLTEEISCITAAASPDDNLVSSIIDAIPPEAVSRGVYPETALRERFLRVERVARRLALVPEEGAALPVYFLSYLQSFFLVNAVNPIPQTELANQPVDINKLDTYDILQRARYWLDRGDFEQTLKYMNLLKGAPRSIARDWMNETRIMLETQQAAVILITHASANGLAYL